MAIKQPPIEHTPKGVRVSLKRLYMYLDHPGEHGNLVFGNDINWPVASKAELLDWFEGLVDNMLEELKKPSDRVPA